MHQLNFVLKVFFLSLAIALVIRYLAPRLNLAATTTNALIAVFLPTLIMAGLLAWKAWQTRSMSSTPGQN